jgi:GT2 family glycosyltransferase
MRVAVVVLNWNGWQDTLECLESLWRSEARPAQVIVCDNDSQDDSVERIKAWAEGRLDVYVPPSHPLRSRSWPPARKPISYVEYGRAEAEKGGRRNDAAPLVLIHVGRNLGFAGGNNVGLRYALCQPDIDFVWLLNNDTVVERDALQHLIDTFEAAPDSGIVGSTLLYYDRPDVVQALGGASYNRWLALPRQIGTLNRVGAPIQEADVAQRLDYVAGASMLVSRRYLETVGLMSEDYFLYFEELDWALRGRGRFCLGYAPKSVVYHKEGASIGTGTYAVQKSWTADYHFMRNRILITRKFLPHCLPTVYAALVVAMLRRARHRQWDRVRMIARLCVSA